MLTGAVISIGDELLRGRIVDTNFAWLAKRLFLLGVRVIHHCTVPDTEEWVCAAFGDAVQRAQVVFSTGGLGPTPDDSTRRGLARFLGRKLVFDQRIAKKIKDFFAARGIEMPESNLAQAYLPQGAVPMDNPEGTAPGIFIKTDEGKLVFLLPGPPREMEAVFRTAEAILRREAALQPIPNAVFRTVGVPESRIEEWVAAMRLPEGVEVAYYPSLRGVDVFITAPDDEALAAAEKTLSPKLEKYTFTRRDGEPLEAVLGELLRERGETVATAESCTGGMLASRIVDIPGSSDYFLGGVVSYANEAKETLLGVSRSTLEEHGAVSSQVATQMSEGVRRRFGATYGIGITGIAGPGGGTPQKPVGLVYISLSTPSRTLCRRYHLTGGRNAVRTRTATAALNILWAEVAFGRVEEYPFEDGGEWV